MGLRLVVAGRVHEPEPGVGDLSRAATARDQDFDPDRRDRMALSVECRVYP